MLATLVIRLGSIKQNRFPTSRSAGCRRLRSSELGPSDTRAAILASLDRGASTVSYVGHGGISVWGGESLFDNEGVSSLSPQPGQPVVMTMNCLNGYFHFPHADALAEALVKAEGKGAIAVFAPSGLSSNTPAHVYHAALVEELNSDRNVRLGDAVSSAQQTYAESGYFPRAPRHLSTLRRPGPGVATRIRRVSRPTVLRRRAVH